MSHPISDKGRTKERFLATKRYNTTYKYEQANATGELTLRYTGKRCSSTSTALSPTCCCDKIIDTHNLLKVMLVFVRFHSTTSSFVDALPLLSGIRGEDAGQIGCYVLGKQEEQQYVNLQVIGKSILGACGCCSV